ncbi:hypothetical protein EB796_003935 [Bugula neritina]|uniref:Uncharacterized protein n=1 Tax=Bugula neritina TaxID=10212 RepID=A0A7J7KHQ0_BUGNE|nr:hypothetical protein EB796_003935 [Bugula neritina]
MMTEVENFPLQNKDPIFNEQDANVAEDELDVARKVVHNRNTLINKVSTRRDNAKNDWSFSELKKKPIAIILVALFLSMNVINIVMSGNGSFSGKMFSTNYTLDRMFNNCTKHFEMTDNLKLAVCNTKVHGDFITIQYFFLNGNMSQSDASSPSKLLTVLTKHILENNYYGM